MIWLIADTHFGHERVIEYENRPFADVHEMDWILMENWNHTVSDGDDVWHLGDFGLCPKPRIREIVPKLKGHKHIVLGNHDRRTGNIAFWNSLGFETVIPFIQPQMHSVYKGIYFSHVPIKECGQFNIHGHIHGRDSGLDPSRYQCVSVECTEYKPIGLDTVCIRAGWR